MSLKCERLGFWALNPTRKPGSLARPVTTIGLRDIALAFAFAFARLGQYFKSGGNGNGCCHASEVEGEGEEGECPASNANGGDTEKEA